MIEKLRTEIEDVHTFIAAWFRGDVACDDALYDAKLAGRMAADLVNIQPSGQMLTRADLVEGIRQGYGGSPEFRISISDVALRAADQSRALVTYVEHQSGAKNSASDNRRISSVWFDVTADTAPPMWLHIHETRCD
ncbi:MAG: hypothetical protein ACI89J_000349 [Hyphomicrobiaceae bacterium]|jgi:hypothetical protein